eukprot:106836_1
MKKKRGKIFKSLAIRRIKKRDRVYFYDFFNSIASIENEKLQFDISQIDYPLHYVFQYISNKIDTDGSIDISLDLVNMEKLFSFCSGMSCFNQIDRSINNHIFFPIIDVINDIDSNKST